jgi:hypothetical protein
MLIAGTTNAPVSKNQKFEINDPTPAIRHG